MDLIFRAIDLELITAMTTEEILHASLRVVASRRMPILIFRDNAKQFELLHVVLAASLETDSTSKYIPDFSKCQRRVCEFKSQIVKQIMNPKFDGTSISVTSVHTALS